MNTRVRDYIERKSSLGGVYQMVRNRDYFLINNSYYLSNERFRRFADEVGDEQRSLDRCDEFELYSGGM